MRVELVLDVDDSDARELWPVYDAVFGDAEGIDEWRASVWDRHAARDGFTLARARTDGELVGFAYGYTGARGQWWTDAVAAAWPADLADEWLGGHFELVSIGVLGSARGQGVGAALLDSLTSVRAEPRQLLMTTSDPADPSRRLYGSRGWQVVGAGLAPDQVVLGRRC